MSIPNPPPTKPRPLPPASPTPPEKKLPVQVVEVRYSCERCGAVHVEK